MTLPDPFAYPRQPHQRKHGPMGYRHYRLYGSWLRDEWSFRCPYCLRAHPESPFQAILWRGDLLGCLLEWASSDLRPT